MSEQVEPDMLKDAYFPVLDYGFIALKDYMGGDEDIVEAARTSYQHGTKKASDDEALIRYLMRHEHTTPFEMVEVKFHCQMPIFVARQWIRHRTASVNELSGRYSIMPLMFYTPNFTDFAPQSMTNKQGREEDSEEDIALGATYDTAVSRWDLMRKDQEQLYKFLLEDGIARELCRIDLPLSTYTNWYWKIDLHNLFHFLKLRCHPHAQKEIRDYAAVMAGIVRCLAPMAYRAWRDYSLGAVTFSREEMRLLQTLIAVEFSVHPDTKEETPIGVLGESSSIYRAEELGPEFGMSKREVADFLKRFSKPHEVPDFDLDLKSAKTGDYFERLAAKHVPYIKKRKK